MELARSLYNGILERNGRISDAEIAAVQARIENGRRAERAASMLDSEEFKGLLSSAEDSGTA